MAAPFGRIKPVSDEQNTGTFLPTYELLMLFIWVIAAALG